MNLKIHFKPQIALLLALISLATLLHAADLDEKSARYHDLLLKKPESAALVSRFLDAWLETADQAALIDLLQQRATAGTAADWRVLAALREFAGNDDAALTALDAAVKLTPDDPATRLARAKILAKLLRLDPALADLQLAAKDPALHLEATTLTGRLQAQAGRPDDALKAWDALLAAHPDDLGLREDLIDLLLQENLTDPALAASRKLTELTKDPYQKAIRRLRTAEILTLANKTAEAAAEYAAILALSAQDSWLEREVLALTQKLFATGQDPAAWQKFLTEALVAAPTRTNLQLALAQHHLASGDTEQALKIHRQLLQTNPGSLPIRQAYIALLQQAGQLQDAAAEVQLLADKTPADPALWQQLATLYQTLGDQPKLQLALDKAIALIPQDVAGALQTAQLYEQFQQPEKARHTLETAAKTQGPQSEAADALANFLARHQQLDQALALWTAAAKTADRENLLRISRALAANGKPTEAHAVLAARIADFPADPLLLSALCQAALLTDQAAATIPHALALLDLGQTPTDTQAAVTLATTLIHRAQLEQQTIDQLAAAAKPSTPRLCLLAQLHESLGDSLSAQKTLQQAAANDPNHTARYQQIALHETRGDLPAAIRALQELIALPGNRKPLLLKQLAALQRRAGNLTEAAATVAEWKTLAPGDKAASLTLAELQTDLGDPQKATAELRRAAAKFGNDPELREKLVQALLDSGSHAEALRLQLQLLDETDAPAAKLKFIPRIAETARNLGREQEIEDLFRKRARENPTATGPLLALRELLTAWQREPEANDFLAQAARLAPTDLDLQSQLADQLEAANQTDQAEALLLNLHQQRPTPDTLRKLSAFYLRTGDDDKSAALTRQLALQTTDPRQLETFVLAALQAGKWQAGLDALTAAKADFSADWRLTYLRAVALEQLGQADAALKLFVPLLQTQTELTNLPKPLANPNQRYSPYLFSRSQLSPDLQACADFGQATRQAYPLDSNSFYGGGFGGGYSSGRPSLYQLALPPDARTLRFCSLAHGIGIAVRKPVDQRAPILAQLALPELPIVPGLLKIAALGERDSLDTLLAANLGDASLAMACMYIDGFETLFSTAPLRNPGRRYSSYSRNNDASIIKPATWALVAEKHQATDPKISLTVSVRVFGYAFSSSGKLPRDTLKQSVSTALAAYRALSAAERKPYIENLLNCTYALMRLPDAAPMANEIVAALTPDLDPADPLHLSLANFTLGPKLQTAALTGDYATAVTLTNQIIANFRTLYQAAAAKYGNSNNRINTYGYRGYYGGSGEMATLVPHWQLANSFNNYEGLLQNATSLGCTFLIPFQSRESGYRQSAPITPALAALLKDLGAAAPAENAAKPPATFTVTDKPAFLAALEKLDDPLLRLIILDAFKYEPEVRAAITTLTEPAANPTVPLLLWSAAYLAARPADRVTAYQLAIHAQAARSDPATTALAGSQLLAIALLLDEKSRATADLDPARSVALRQAKSIVENSQRKTFAKHLETLGLKDAAVRLAKPASAAALARRSGGYRNSYPTARRVPVAALVHQGNRPAAARQLYRQLAASLQPNNSSYGSSSDVFSQASQLKLVPDIAAAMRPPATASFKRRAEFIKIMCRLAPAADYRDDLEKLHAENPDDTEILALFCSVTEPARAAELFKTLAARPDNDLFDVGQQLLKRDDDSPRTAEAFQATLDRWTAVIALLDAIPASQSSGKNLTWVNYNMLQLVHNNFLAGIAMPPFRSPPPKLRDQASAEEKERFETAGKLAKLRDATIHAVATAMLKHPGTASQGFELLSAGRVTLGLDEAALYQLAVQSLQTTLPASLAVNADTENQGDSRQQRRWSLILQNGGSNSEGSSVPGGILPEYFLARYAIDHPDQNVPATVIAGLPATLAEQLGGWLAFFAKPTAAEAATRLKQLTADPAQLRVFLAANTLGGFASREVSPAFELLFAAIEPATLVSSGKPQDSADPFGDPVPKPTEATAVIISRWLNTPDVALRWDRLRQLAILVLGPEKHWPAYASINLQTSGDAAQPARTRLSRLIALINPQADRQLIRDYLPIRFLRSIGLPASFSSESLQRTLLNLTSGGTPAEKAARCQELIDQIIAANLFLPGPGMINDDGSVLPFGLIRSPSQETGALLGEALLKVTGPNRFWATLTGTLLAKKPSATFLPLLQQELPAIKKWPLREQMAFAAFLVATWPDLEKSKVGPWLAASTRDLTKTLATRLAETLEATRNDNSTQSRTLSQTLALLRRDPAKAAAVWNDALTGTGKDSNPPLAGSHQRARLEEAYSQLFQTFAYSNISNISDVSATARLRWVLIFSQTPAHRALAVKSSNLDSQLSSLFSSIFSSSRELLPPKWKALQTSPAAGLIPLFDVLSDQDLEGNSRLVQVLIQQLTSYIHALNAKSLETFETWLKQEVEPRKPRCAKLARLMLAQGFARSGSSNDAKLAGRLLAEAANALLADPATDATTRIVILANATEYQTAEVLANPAFLAYVLAWCKEPPPLTAESLDPATTLVKALSSLKSLPPETAAHLAKHTLPALAEIANTNSSSTSFQTDILPTWLALAHRSGDKKAIENLVASNLPAFAGRYEHLTQLALDGYPEIAATLVPKPAEVSVLDSCYLYGGGSNGTVKFRFTKTLEAALPALLAAIPDPQQRYRTECVMQLYHDATDDAEKPLVARDERVAKLAARFATDAPPQQQAKLEILCGIASSANAELAATLRPLCGNLSMGDLLEQRQQPTGSGPDPAALQRLEFQMCALDRLISIDLGDDNSATFFKQALSLTLVDGNTQYSARDRLKVLFQFFAPRSLTAILHAPADQKAKLLQQVCALTTAVTGRDAANQGRYFVVQWRLYLLLAHAAAGQGKALDAWWQAQPAAFKKAISLQPGQSIDQYARIQSYQSLKGQPFATKDHPNAKQELFLALLTDPSLSAIEIDGLGNLSRMIDAKLFTQEEMNALIDAVPDDCPRKCEYLCEKASMMAWLHNQIDESAAAYDVARAHAKAHDIPGGIDCINAHQAYMYLTHKRPDEALKIARATDLSKMPPIYQFVIDDLEALLKKHAKDPKAPSR
jgi:predicted Zn-dependent protease